MLDLQATTGAQPRRKAEGTATTLGDQLDSQLARLLRSLGQSAQIGSARRLAHVLSESWRNELTSRGPQWSSDITDDHSPFEFSMAMSGSSTTLRILTEPQEPGRPSLSSSWRLAENIHEKLASKWGVGLAGYRKVAELFEPASTDTGLFSVWHSAILGEAPGAQFKVYLNPAIHGASSAIPLLSEALRRLGLDRAWNRLHARICTRGALDEVLYFSLDLSDTADARAKIYVAHRHADANDLTRALEACPGFNAADVDRWCRHFLGSVGPFQRRPPITCFALGRQDLELRTTTLHLPVRSYLSDDLYIARRVCALFGSRQRLQYMRALTELAERPLQQDAGIQTYVSLRPSGGKLATTVYLAPEIYRAATSRSSV